MNQFLLDTQIVLWMANEPDNISEKCYEVILNNENQLFFSYASVWEISIKLSINKLNLHLPLSEFIKQETERHDLIMLPVSLQSIYFLQSLPLIHRDPFDRILAAQSMVENIPLISSDKYLMSITLKESGNANSLCS